MTNSNEPEMTIEKAREIIASFPPEFNSLALPSYYYKAKGFIQGYETRKKEELCNNDLPMCNCNGQPDHSWNYSCIVSPPGMPLIEVLRCFPSDGGLSNYGLYAMQLRQKLDSLKKQISAAREALENLVSAATDFDCQICGNGSCAETCEKRKAEEALRRIGEKK